MIKRALDLVVATLAVVTMAPAMLLVALIVRWKLGTPVLFKQLRPGRHGKVFRLNKFRTMRDRRDEYGHLLPDEQRLTSIGRLLRSTSLDELPSLWNVIRGDMSLVGPRPLLIEYLDRYTPDQARRHDVKPGITGWAQVHGRNRLTWEEKFALDVWYVDHWTLSLDFAILWLTLSRVLTRDGISAHGHSTMPDFQGPVELQ